MSILDGYDRVALNSVIRATKDKKILWDVIPNDLAKDHKDAYNKAAFLTKIPKYTLIVSKPNEGDHFSVYTGVILRIYNRISWFNSHSHPTLYLLKEIVDIPEPKIYIGYLPASGGDPAEHELISAIKDNYTNNFGNVINETPQDLNQFIRDIKNVK